tara:strand:- start:137 stop:418 length:282 start_codon:yes stop_codon:yes gene_type:complete
MGKKIINLILANLVVNTVGRTSAQLIPRAASFMLFADSRTSFAIEGERLPRNPRLERWGDAVLEAGKYPLNQTKFYRLHRILLGDNSFTQVDY